MGKLVLAFLAASAGLSISGAASAAPTHRAAHARGVADPRAFVEQMYAAYVRGHGDSTPPAPVRAYSPRLAALFATYDAWQRRHSDEVGSIDFDWWINAQDWELANVSVTQADSGRNARTVTARWQNSGRADSSRFLFVRIGGRWYLDDAANGSGHGGDGWTLSALLRHPQQ
jgi:hypothetical protein